MKGGGHGFRLPRFALGRNDNSRNPLRLGNVSGAHTAAVISSSAGAIIRHGPHHSAQKSTTTGSCALSTSASKVASDTLPTPMGHLVFLPEKGRVRRPRNRRAERRNAGRERQGAAGGRAAMKTGETYET